MQVRNAQGQYQPLNLNQTYQVITINFLADGQDFYSSFKNITGERRTDVGLDYAEAFLQYVQALDPYIGTKQIKKLDTKHYSTQDFLDIAK